jgi:single-strand DNA-binding protein
MSLGVSSHTTDMTTVSFCTEPSSCIMLYSVHECALCKSMARRRAPHEARSPSAHPALILLAQKTAADACPKGLCPTPDGPHALPGDYLVRCISNTTAALDMGILQERPRGDHGMAQMHRVYFVGNLTRNPEVCYAPNGMAVARCGVAVPTRLRQGDTWHTDVCCIDVVAFGPQAETVGASLHKGRGVLIEGRLQWRRWKQAGQSRLTREVIVERIQCLPRPQSDIFEAAEDASSPKGT